MFLTFDGDSYPLDEYVFNTEVCSHSLCSSTHASTAARLCLAVQAHALLVEP